jgi:tetratricopeptide (TPR) repeat protein
LAVFAYSCTDSSRWKALNEKYFEYERSGQYDSALIAGLEALEEANLRFSKADARIGKTHNNVAEMYRELGQFEEARLYYQKSISTFQLDGEHLNLKVVYSNLGTLFYDRDQFDSARFYYKQALDVPTSSCSNDITALINLAGIEIKNSDSNGARSYLERTKKCLVDNKISDNSVFGKYWSVYGHLLLLEKDNDSAFYYLDKSKLLRESLFGRDHPSLGVLYNQIGAYYMVIQQYDSAKSYLVRSIDIRRTSDGALTEKSYQAIHNLGRLYQILGDSGNGAILIDASAELKERLKNTHNTNL